MLIFLNAKEKSENFRSSNVSPESTHPINIHTQHKNNTILIISLNTKLIISLKNMENVGIGMSLRLKEIISFDMNVRYV